MADINVQNSPSTPPAGRGSGAVWAVVAVVLLFLLAWYFFFRGGDGGADVNVDVNTPAAEAPAGGAAPAAPAGGTATP